MGNADRIATRITDEYRLGDAEALEHITAIVRAGGAAINTLERITGILAESGRNLSDEGDDVPSGYDPDSGEFIDFDDGADALGEGMHEEELSLIDACLDDIRMSRYHAASEMAEPAAEDSITTPQDARRIGGQIGIDWDTVAFTEEEFARGLEVEAEHGPGGPGGDATDVTRGNPLTEAKIALAHLLEMPDYYTRLVEMESNQDRRPGS